MKPNEIISKRSPVIYLTIAPSGAGKSTIFKKLKERNPDLVQFSWDNLRHEWYDAHDYKKAFELSTKDKQFGIKANNRFRDLISSNDDIFVDNTNLTPKRRQFYLDLAKKHNYKTIAITFNNVDIEELCERQKTRGDKCVPDGAVKQQFNSLVKPSNDEFDEIIDADQI